MENIQDKEVAKLLSNSYEFAGSVRVWQTVTGGQHKGFYCIAQNT